MNVPPTLHVSVKNVKIHAKATPVVSMPNVWLETTELSVFALMDLSVIRSPFVKNVRSIEIFVVLGSPNLLTVPLFPVFFIFVFFFHKKILAGCKSDSECPQTQACISRECQNPCLFEQCGVNAECSVRNHRPKCTCLPGHKGNPYDRCRQYECLTDPDCATTLTCRNEKCVDPCDCALNAECTPVNHRGICECFPDHTGDPYGRICDPSKNSFQFIQ